MGNSRDYYVISKDGTILYAHDCMVVHLNQEELDNLSENVSDNERYSAASKFSRADTVAGIMYSLYFLELKE